MHTGARECKGPGHGSILYLFRTVLCITVSVSAGVTERGQRRLSTQKGGEAGVPLCPLGPAWARIRGCQKPSAAEHDDDDDGPCWGHHPNINTKSAGVGGAVSERTMDISHSNNSKFSRPCHA